MDEIESASDRWNTLIGESGPMWVYPLAEERIPLKELFEDSRRYLDP